MIKKILYIGIVLIAYFLFMSMFTRYRFVDTYVSENFSRDMNDVQNILNQMCKEISYDGKYKYYTVEEMLEIVVDADLALLNVCNRLHNYSTLNENYDVRLYGAEDVVHKVRETLESGQKLSEDQLKLLNQVVELNETYSNLGRSVTYQDDKNPLTLMSLPKAVDDYIEALEVLEMSYE